MKRFINLFLALIFLCACLDANAVSITTRSGKGSTLTHNELDANFKHEAVAKTGAYTVVESDNRATIEVSGGAYTMTLDDISTITAASDTGEFEVTIKNTDSSNNVTVTRSGTDTIDGETSHTIYPGQGAVFKINQATDGWNVISTSYPDTMDGVTIGANDPKPGTFTGVRTEGTSGANMYNLQITDDSSTNIFNTYDSNGNLFCGIQASGLDGAGAGGITFFDCDGVSVGSIPFTANDVDIGGGEIDDTDIGATTPANGKFDEAVIEDVAPYLIFDDTNQTATETQWGLKYNAGTLQFITLTDAGADAEPAMYFQRTGTTVDKVTMPNGTFEVSDGIENTDIGQATPAAGTFDALNVTNSAGKQAKIIESDAAADNGTWVLAANGEAFFGTAYNDAESAAEAWLTVERTDEAIDTVSIPNGTFDVVDGIEDTDIGQTTPGAGSFTSITDNRSCISDYDRVSPGLCLRPSTNGAFSSAFAWDDTAPYAWKTDATDTNFSDLAAIPTDATTLILTVQASAATDTTNRLAGAVNFRKAGNTDAGTVISAPVYFELVPDGVTDHIYVNHWRVEVPVDMSDSSTTAPFEYQPILDEGDGGVGGVSMSILGYRQN